MKELLEQYSKIVPSIFEKFGIKDGYGEIQDCTKYLWNCSGFSRGDSVYWKHGEDGELYSNEIVHTPRTFENYVLFYVDNGSGENYYQIFDTTLKNQYLEEEF